MKEKYDLCGDLREKYRIDELASKTLEYRINGFIRACDMNLENSVYDKDISTTRLSYIKIYSANNEVKYTLNLSRSSSSDGFYITLSGKYNGIDIFFRNYYDKDVNKNRINEIPFHISINKKHNNYDYGMEIKTISKYQTKFIFRKSREDMIISNVVSFEANILDFSRILKLVKTFVNNPELVFNSTNQVLRQKKNIFTNRDIDKVIVEDEALDEPVKGFRKIMKVLFK